MVGKRVHAIMIALLVGIWSSAAPDGGEASTFAELREAEWRETFTDSCTGNWRDNWFLDGVMAKVTNDADKMVIDASDGYAVLWTKPEFAGDLKVEYDFRRADTKNWGVNIIYLQARGDGQDGHKPDIAQWSDRRESAAMKDYFLNMHTYHVSYAAYPTRGNNVKDYVRARRYMPLANKGLKDTALANEYQDTGLFEDKEWVRVTIIKRDRDVWMEFKHPTKTVLCHFLNKDKPAITAGRIGLRLMPGRESHVKNFKVSELAK